MHLQRKVYSWFRLFMFSLFLLIPALAKATPAISVVATTPFSSSYIAGQTATATYTITNLLSDLTLTIVNQTEFPSGSGLSIASNTCTTLAPAATCTIQVGFTAPATAQTVTGTLLLWPQPTAQGIKTPITITVTGIDVTPSAGAGGSISPSTVQTVNSGENLTFTATPDSGYAVDEWYLDGNPVQSGGTTYTLTNITTTHTVSVTFIQTFTVTPSAGANGSISPSTVQTVNSGSNVMFTATADSGYAINEWKVDGVLVQTGGSTYTITSIAANHTISISFIQLFTVTPSAGSNGSISPPTPETVQDGANSSPYTAAPDPGYLVDTWYENAVAVQTGGTTYTATNVTQDIALSVTFKTPTGISMAAGQNITGSVGLVAVSTDAATTWSTATLPSIPANSYFNDGTCIGSDLTGVCVAAGSTTAEIPVLYASTDGGATWASESVTSQATTGIYHATTCSGVTVTAVCTAVGQDTTAGGAMAAVSTNGSNTWANKTITGNPATGVFNGTACTGTGGTAICIAVGRDVTNSPPLLAASVDGGSTWNVATITDNVSSGTLYDASCTGSSSTATCVAAGYDITDVDPILVQSTDGGSTWATKYIAGAPAQGILYGVSCIDGDSTARCVAVGRNESTSAPFIAVTTDNGTTWTAIPTITGAPSAARLNSVSCSGTGDAAFCAAAGNVTPAGAPFIAQSSDGGATWSTATITSPPTTATLSKISCTGNTNTTVCTAFGQDTTNTNGIVIKTKDAGTTWTLPTITGLPTDSTFNGGSSSGGTLKTRT